MRKGSVAAWCSAALLLTACSQTGTPPGVAGASARANPATSTASGAPAHSVVTSLAVALPAAQGTSPSAGASLATSGGAAGARPAPSTSVANATASTAPHTATTEAPSSSTASTTASAVTTVAEARAVSASPPAWNGAQVAVQSGTTLALALPAPTAADAGKQPIITIPNMPSPTVSLLPGGATALRAPIPARASGVYTLTARWPDGQEGQIRLTVGATVTLAGGLGNPDDLAIAPDGSVLYTDLTSNTVGQIPADGSRRILIAGLNVPEGLAVTGAKTLLLADQGTDRVFQWTAPGSLRLLHQLSPAPGSDGIDGLSASIIGGQLTALLPDSPNGRLLLLPLNTLTPTTFVGRWQRPTDALIANGQLYVVDEYGGRLWRGPVQGPLQPVGPAMTLPDDVAVDPNGVAFVNDLGQGATGGRIERIGPNGQGTALLTGLNDPQGIDLDGVGNLIFTESGASRIAADIQSCLPILLGGANITLKAGAPPQALPLGTDCAAGKPSFALAPGALWPAPSSTTWPTGSIATLTLPNGARASLDGAGAILLLQPPQSGAGGTSTLAVQMRIGQQTVARQVVVTVSHSPRRRASQM